MSPDRYKKVKEIFLEACDKPREEQTNFVLTAAGGDAEIQREVEGLLKEHQREQPLIAKEPEGPLGPMSAILSRAGIQVPGGKQQDITAAWGGDSSEVDNADSTPRTRFDDDEAHDQTSGTHSGIVDPGRFPAGTMIAGRYRIIEMLGRGGMGEVYRADDITLNQSVALKFLPALFGSDAKWLERFRNEVRLSRQVTHPNVCRVFDIGEYQGEQFLSMEYVDGENLASLLRRIGRVPHDKAILLARQLCAGIAAAHDRGVLHRDLKPANVMIDGRGSVRITDFGLAAPADQLKTDAIRAGTPAYMSPEQLAGKSVTVRSDVYSLGLVLYEMFTGRRAFRADSLRAYQKLHSTEEPTPPSEIIEDIDPIVDRAIMRCLEKDPKDRPASAMAVSAALPGGNPLREILAAGETPSPEVVAAAGEAHGVMRPRLALTLLLTALACLIGFVWTAPHVFVIQRALYSAPNDRTVPGAADKVVNAQPAVLQDTAQKILAQIGYDYLPRDTARGFELNRGYYLHEENQKDRHLWNLWRSRLGLVYFWYRQSPELLVPTRAEGSVGEHDPPSRQPGMINVRLDPAGRLIGLEVEPSTPSRLVPAPDTEPAATGRRLPPPPPARASIGPPCSRPPKSASTSATSTRSPPRAPPRSSPTAASPGRATSTTKPPPTRKPSASKPPPTRASPSISPSSATGRKSSSPKTAPKSSAPARATSSSRPSSPSPSSSSAATSPSKTTTPAAATARVPAAWPSPSSSWASSPGSAAPTTSPTSSTNSSSSAAAWARSSTPSASCGSSTWPWSPTSAASGPKPSSPGTASSPAAGSTPSSAATSSPAPPSAS